MRRKELLPGIYKARGKLTALSVQQKASTVALEKGKSYVLVSQRLKTRTYDESWILLQVLLVDGLKEI